MKYDGLSLVASCIYCFVIGFVVGSEFAMRKTVYQRELIERGLALYCPHNGEFAFKGEC